MVGPVLGLLTIESLFFKDQEERIGRMQKVPGFSSSEAEL